ncbi:hypothetical protein [Streptomyces sp. NPDC059063]|uniref:hypothetical protein n=1 Tax=unclassified Streptomyces TaxID=2593676 RepID=UPI0036C07747
MGRRATCGTRVGGHRRWARATAVALAVGALATAVTSCGSEDKPVRLSGGTFTKELPPEEARGLKLATDGMELLKSTPSLRMEVSMTAGSTTAGTARRQEISLHIDRQSNCTGTFDMGTGQSGELIVVKGRASYVRFTDESLDMILRMAESKGPQVAATARERVALVRGKYLKVPKRTGGAAGRMSAPTDQCDLDKAFAELEAPGADGSDDKIQAKSPTYRYGKHVIPLVDPTGEADASMYVAAEGKPYVTAFEMEENGSRMVMKMSDYGKPVEVEAPPASMVVDADDVRGPAGADLFEV